MKRKCRMQNAECRMNCGKQTAEGSAPWVRSALTFCILYSAFCISSGCSIMGALAYKFSPPPRVPPEHVLANEPLVVFAERSDNPANRTDADRVALYTTDGLRANTQAPVMDAGSASALTSNRQRTFGDAAMKTTVVRMSPAQVGKAVGASQVLHVDLIKFEVQPAMGADVIGGQAELRIAVIDVATGRPIWPRESAQGRLMTVSLPPSPTSVPPTADQVRVTLAQTCGERVARLFYEWEQPGMDAGTPVEK